MFLCLHMFSSIFKISNIDDSLEEPTKIHGEHQVDANLNVFEWKSFKVWVEIQIVYQSKSVFLMFHFHFINCSNYIPNNMMTPRKTIAVERFFWKINESLINITNCSKREKFHSKWGWMNSAISRMTNSLIKWLESFTMLRWCKAFWIFSSFVLIKLNRCISIQNQQRGTEFIFQSIGQNQFTKISRLEEKRLCDWSEKPRKLRFMLGICSNRSYWRATLS